VLTYFKFASYDSEDYVRREGEQVAKKQKSEHLFMMYPNERDLLRFYSNLPGKAKKRLRLYSKWNCLCFAKEDYDALKERKMINEDEHKEKQVVVEANIKFKLHNDLSSAQVIPWGVSRVQAPKVWDVTEGNTVKVGIIDTGIDGKHPDLRGNVKGGVNTYNSTSPFTDENGHGTHVAGTVAALNNSFGVVGVAPRVELYALKCFSPDGTATLTDIAQAIDWAIHHQVHVLNMSFGSREESQILHSAIKAALRAGIIMIASSGNASESLDYPARYPEVFAIGAIDQKDRVAKFSNYGRTLNYVAPGVDILSTWPVAPGYNTLSGTSMASPHISGLCALLLSQAPHLSPLQLKQIFDRAAQRLPGVSLVKQGRGVVTAPRVLSELAKAKKGKSSTST